MFADRLHRALQRALARTGLAEHVIEDRDRVDARQRGLRFDHVPFLQHVAFAAVDGVTIGEKSPVAAIVGLESVLGDAFDQMIVTHAIFDEIADRPDLHVMLTRETDQVVEAGHGPVLVHDLADHSRGIEPRETRDIDRSLGMARADQHAAVARRQREDMARSNDVVGTLRRIDRDGDGARPIRGADTSGNAFLGLDRSREGCLHAFAIVAAHGLQAERFDPLAVERQTNQAPAVRCHEIDRGRRCHLRGDDQIAFVFPIFVVDEDVHAAIARFVDDFLGTDDHGSVVIGFEKGLELGQSVRSGVPAILVAVAQGVGVKTRSAGKTGAGHETLRNQRANFFDGVHGSMAITS